MSREKQTVKPKIKHPVPEQVGGAPMGGEPAQARVLKGKLRATCTADMEPGVIYQVCYLGTLAGERKGEKMLCVLDKGRRIYLICCPYRSWKLSSQGDCGLCFVRAKGISYIEPIAYAEVSFQTGDLRVRAYKRKRRRKNA